MPPTSLAGRQRVHLLAGPGRDEQEHRVRLGHFFAGLRQLRVHGAGRNGSARSVQQDRAQAEFSSSTSAWAASVPTRSGTIAVGTAGSDGGSGSSDGGSDADGEGSGSAVAEGDGEGVGDGLGRSPSETSRPASAPSSTLAPASGACAITRPAATSAL